MMFMYKLMFTIFGLFLMLFCDTTLSKCNNTSTCACIVPDGEVTKLINFISKGSLKIKKANVSRMFYVDLCTNIQKNITEIRVEGSAKENGWLCAIILHAAKPINLGIVEYSNLSSVPGCKNVSVSIASGNFTAQTYVNCYAKYNAHIVPDTNYDTIPQVPKLQTMNMLYKKQLSTNGLSTGSILVMLLFVFSGLYFIGGAILLKFLRGATGWEVLPNHKFWRDLPSLIRDGIAFTFNCCRADSYERI